MLWEGINIIIIIIVVVVVVVVVVFVVIISIIIIVVDVVIFIRLAEIYINGDQIDTAKGVFVVVIFILL